jgi:spermidine/putrescine-binding protein
MATASRVVAQDGGTFNWMTWSDHYYDEQLGEVATATNITPSISELAGNAEGFAKLKEVGGQLDLISGDALWVPHYFDEALIEPMDINALEVAKTLYPVAREFEIWTTPDGGYLGYPFGWSPVLIYYNPEFVTPDPTSYEVLFDPKYAARVMMENQPEEVMAHMGIATGAVDPYNMTEDELAAAKDAAFMLKPNIVRFSQQNTDTINALTSGEAWLATGNLGTETRVKEAGGPEIRVFTPSEGSTGWMDAEMIVTGGANTALIAPFLERAMQPEYIAENFIRYGRPLFNEQAYKLLVDAGEQERADQFLFNKPETVLNMRLKGPGISTGAAIAAFNEVFGA